LPWRGLSWGLRAGSLDAYNHLTEDLLKKIENILNNMPRKILGYKTPNQVWKENI
jgi:IS30 family transposase